jgi:polyphosphate kinase 2 (PPK2 family)
MKHQPLVVKGPVKLKHFDPGYTAGLDKAKIKDATDAHGHRIGKLQPLLYANPRQAVLLIFQGMDASGKDGSIRTVLDHVNPAGVTVTNFKVPSEEEKAHD